MLNLRSEQQVLAILEFYKKHLKDVSFPSLDLSILDKEHQLLKTAQQEIVQQERLLAEKTRSATEVFEHLEKQCLKALSYAQIFFENDADLLEQCISLKDLTIKNKRKSKARKKVIKKKVHLQEEDRQRFKEIVPIDFSKDSPKLENEVFCEALDPIQEQDLSAELLLHDENHQDELSQYIYDEL